MNFIEGENLSFYLNKLYDNNIKRIQYLDG